MSIFQSFEIEQIDLGAWFLNIIFIMAVLPQYYKKCNIENSSETVRTIFSIDHKRKMMCVAPMLQNYNNSIVDNWPFFSKNLAFSVMKLVMMMKSFLFCKKNLSKIWYGKRRNKEKKMWEKTNFYFQMMNHFVIFSI